jgi:hypothetical protein
LIISILVTKKDLVKYNEKQKRVAKNRVKVEAPSSGQAAKRKTSETNFSIEQRTSRKKKDIGDKF